MVRILILGLVLFVMESCTVDQHIGLLMCEKQCSEIQDCFMITYYQQTLVCQKQGGGHVVKNNSKVIMIQVKYKGCGLENSCGEGSSSVKNRRNACVCLQNSGVIIQTVILKLKELDKAIMLTSKADVISTRNEFNKQRQMGEHAQLLKDLKGRELHNQSKSNLTTIEKLKMMNTTRENQNTTEPIHMRTNPKVNKVENHNQLLKHNSNTIGPMNITNTRGEVLNQRIIDQLNISRNETKKIIMDQKKIKTIPGVNNRSTDDVKKKLNPKTMDHMNMSKNYSKEIKRNAKAIMDKMNITKELSVDLRGDLKMKSKPRPLKQVDMEKKRAEKVAQRIIDIMKGKNSDFTGPMGQTPKTKHQGNEANNEMGPNPRSGDQIYTQRNETLNKLRDLLYSRRIRKNNNTRPDFKIRGQMDMGRNEYLNNSKPNQIPKDQRHTRRHGDDNQIRDRTRDHIYARRDKENTQLRNNSFKGRNGDDMHFGRNMQENSKKRQSQRRDLVNLRRQEDNINLRANPSTRDQGDPRYTRRNGDGGNKHAKTWIRDQIYRGRNEENQMRPNPRTSEVNRGRKEGNNTRPNQRTSDKIYRGRSEENQMRRNPRTSGQTYRGRNEENQMRPNPRTSDMVYRGRNEGYNMRRNPRTSDKIYRGRNEDNQMRRNPRTSGQTYRGRNEENQMRRNPRSGDKIYRGRNEDNQMRKGAMNMNNANMRHCMKRSSLQDIYKGLNIL